jgi:hypothetical protein
MISRVCILLPETSNLGHYATLCGWSLRNLRQLVNLERDVEKKLQKTPAQAEVGT